MATKEIKLPKLDVPLVDENYEKCRSSFDLFEASIDYRNALTTINEDISQGKSNAVDFIYATNICYLFCYLKFLVDRYQTIPAIVRSYTHAMCSRPVVETNNYKELIF